MLLPKAGLVARRLRRLPLPQERPPATTSFDASLYSLKAFSIATAIVLATASASVAAAGTCLDVRDPTEFAARMRSWVSQSMPLLIAKIYRPPTPKDSVPEDPVLSAAQHQQPTTFDHDASQQRLADAFDRGGPTAWAEAAAKELEAESQVERMQRTSANRTKPPAPE